MEELSSDEFWARRPVLVTGATGYLGGWLVKELLERGARVVALVRRPVPESMFSREGLAESTEVIPADLSDLDRLRQVCDQHQIKTVFHTAAQALAGEAVKEPIETLETNVRGTWNLLEATRQANVSEVVVSSSDKAYGAASDLPYREDHPMDGRYPYDVSKSCADLICRMYAETFDLPVCVTRCGNLYGGGDLNWNRVVPGVIRATHFGERFVIRSDGEYVRDFLYVRDAAECYLELAERLSTDSSIRGQAFNYSLEIQLTILDLARRILGMMNRSDLEPVILNEVNSEVREQYMTAEKARKTLGWSPRHGLDGGLEETIAWYREFLGQP